MKRLFGSSGVRGLANVDLTPRFAAQVGLAVATFSKAKKVLVARDTRDSGLMFEKAVVSGLTSGGADVYCLGVVPTPVLAFLIKRMNADAAIMITASHNPPPYNGIKIFDCRGLAYDDEAENEIEDIIAHENFALTDWRVIGIAKSTDQTSDYIDSIPASVTLQRAWHVVVDAGCGATHAVAPKILTRLGCKLTTLNSQPDGFFPARSPEPTPESLMPLAGVVKCLNADLGVAYDGDGDRVAFVDHEGRFAEFDRALASYAAYMTGKKGGGTVVTNIEASMCIDRMVEANGGKVIRTKVGDVYVSKEIMRRRAVFGGEPCGAWIHPQFHYCPDGILSSVLLLKALDIEGITLADFVSRTPKFPTLRKNVACKNDAKYKVAEELVQGIKTAFPSYRELSKVDGLRIVLEEGWLLVRASGTEPMIRLTAEGESLKTAKEIMRKAVGLVSKTVGKVK